MSYTWCWGDWGGTLENRNICYHTLKCFCFCDLNAICFPKCSGKKRCYTPNVLCQQALGTSRRRPGLHGWIGEHGRAMQKQETVREDPTSTGAHG